MCFALAVTLSGQTLSVAPASLSAPEPAQAQGGSPAPAAPARVWLGPNGQPLPFKSDEEVMEFLRTAKVVKIKDIPTGVAHPRKALLEKDGIQMNAVFRDINEDRQVAKLSGGMEMFFRDAYILECAAYEMAQMLGMDNVPPVVLRKVQGTEGSLQIWVENVMTSGDRIKNKVTPPDQSRWNLQLYTMHFFDALVYNTDRNPGNILIDKDWKIWLIDHTRAFRRQEELWNPQYVGRVERKMWERLQALDPAEIRRRMSPYLRGFEIDSLIKRREKLIALVRQRIAERGEDGVLFDWN